MTSLVVRSVTPCQHKRNISNELDEIAGVHYNILTPRAVVVEVWRTGGVVVTRLPREVVVISSLVTCMCMRTHARV